MTSQIAPNASRHAEVVRDAAVSSAPVHSAVAASWRRSLMHHKLDPKNYERRPRLESASIRERREESEILLRVVRPALDRLAGVALDSGNAVLLADPAGLVLERMTHAADDAIFGTAGLDIGADWSEASEGTNGIGTSLADARPTVIWRDQHFFSRNLPLICVGAPVEAPDGTLAGVINFSSCRDDMSQVQTRLLAIAVQDAAVQTATALFHARFNGARIITLGTEPGRGPSLLAVDGDDLVLGANRAARRALGLTPHDLDRHLPLADLLAGDGDPVNPQGRLTDALRSEVTRALRRTNGNVSRAARDLGIGRATLYRKMKALGLEHRAQD